MSTDTHGPLAHHFDSLEQQHGAAAFGMWVFLITEAMLFGAVLTAYAVYRTAHTAEFREASLHLSITLGGINTAILLTSSLTMALAVLRLPTRPRPAGRPQHAPDRRCWAWSSSASRSVEWGTEYHEGLVPWAGFNFERGRGRGWTRAGCSSFLCSTSHSRGCTRST